MYRLLVQGKQRWKIEIVEQYYGLRYFFFGHFGWTISQNYANYSTKMTVTVDSENVDFTFVLQYSRRNIPALLIWLAAVNDLINLTMIRYIILLSSDKYRFMEFHASMLAIFVAGFFVNKIIPVNQCTTIPALPPEPPILCPIKTRTNIPQTQSIRSNSRSLPCHLSIFTRNAISS